MEEIAAVSGGAVHYAGAISDLDALFDRITEELRHVYVLGYAPSNPLSNGGYRRIEVRVPGAPDVAVRHRLGYMASP
jgi:hypothetical protein